MGAGLLKVGAPGKSVPGEHKLDGNPLGTVVKFGSIPHVVMGTTKNYCKYFKALLLHT